MSNAYFVSLPCLKGMTKTKEAGHGFDRADEERAIQLSLEFVKENIR